MKLPKGTWILALGVGSLLAASPQLQAQSLIYGLGPSNTLVSFSSVPVGGLITTSAPLAITNLGTGQTVVGIDFRPLDGLLYAVARDAANAGFLYTVNPMTGAATNIAVNTMAGTPPGPFTLTGNVGIDFNPVAVTGQNALRVVTTGDQDYRLAGFGLGTPTSVNNNVDGTLNPGDPSIIGAGYTNNAGGVPGGGGQGGTTLFTIDSVTNSLNIQNPPNAGTQTLVGPLGINIADGADGDLDIVTTTNRALATLSTDGVNYSLYEVNLTSGNAALLGNFAGTQVRDIAAPIPEPTSVALMAASAALLGLVRRRRA